VKSGANPEKLALRPAVPADYPALLSIQRAAYGLKEVPLYGPDLPPLRETPESLATEVASGKQILVGEIDGVVVASLRLQVRPDGEVYFGRLSVNPELQGKGIGQGMLRGIEAYFPSAPSFALDCGVRSEENNHIYSKHGYVLTGETFQVPGGPMVQVMRKVRK
jgi:predicted GNAT family N-acyltransferase